MHYCENGRKDVIRNQPNLLVAVSGSNNKCTVHLPFACFGIAAAKSCFVLSSTQWFETIEQANNHFAQVMLISDSSPFERITTV